MNNISDKNEDSIEEMPSPEATPIRMQQREFIKDIRATAPSETIISIKQLVEQQVDSDPDDSIIIDQKLAQMKSNDEKMILNKKF